MDTTKRVALITDASYPAAEIIERRLEDDGIIVLKNYPQIGNGDAPNEIPDSFSYNTWSHEDMNTLLDMIIDRVGRIDYLIQTENHICRSLIEDISEEDFKKALDYNIKSAFMTTKVFGGYMACQGRGAIVYLSSIHDEKPTGCAFAYSVAKGAVKMLCKEIALFYGRKGVRANVMEIGLTEKQQQTLDSTITPFNYDPLTKIPLGRLAEAEDIAGIVYFLLSEDASFINGADIRVDGGHLLYYIDR